MIQRIKDKVRRDTRNILFRRESARVHYNPSENYYIFSDPRGGSTWLTEILMRILKLPVIWEPLHLDYHPNLRSLNFSWRTFLQPNDEWPALKVTMEEVLSGKVLNHNLCHLNRPGDYKQTRHALVKFCRANGIYPWLAKHIAFNNKPVHLVRHPFAVAVSQMKQGAWDHKFEGIEIPSAPFNSYYLQHQEFLLSLSTKLESLVAYWSMGNALILKYESELIRVYYEDLYLNPQKEVQRILDGWGIEQKVTAKDSLTQLSKTTVDFSLQNQLSKWTSYLDQSQIKSMLRVLEYFEVDIYSDNPLPIRR
ncbi:MAG: sulfotransferase domain-containing protein [Marinoscillum sp.]